MKPENSKFRTQFPHLSQFFLLSCEFNWLKKETKKGCKYLIYNLVPRAGLEPALPQWKQDFKSCVSTSSTTRAESGINPVHPFNPHPEK